VSRNEFPIACVLNVLTAAERKREKTLLDLVRSTSIAKEETVDGYMLLFPDDPILLAQIGEFLSLERRCCPFFTFQLTAGAEKGLISLHISGREGVKAFLAHLLFP
jgi:hypothetical protein